MLNLLIGFSILSATAAQLPSWEFNATGDPAIWKPIAGITNLATVNGRMSFDVVGSGGYFYCDGLSINAARDQCVIIRVKASRAGDGNLLWAGDGQEIGWDRREPVRVPGHGRQTVVVFPFWQSVPTVTKLRLDFYGPSHFEVDSIRVVSYGGGKQIDSKTTSWELGSDLAKWRVAPESDWLFAPPLELSMADRRIVNLRLCSDVNLSAAILYNMKGVYGIRRKEFRISKSEETRDYNVYLPGIIVGRGDTAWRDPVQALGIEIPHKLQPRVHIESISVTDTPKGPGRLSVRYLGFNQAINRAGKPCEVVAEVENTGGASLDKAPLSLKLPSGLRLAGGEVQQTVSTPPFAHPLQIKWPVVADAPGQYTVKVSSTDGATSASIRFLPTVDTPKAAYPPKPRPVKTGIDILAYYFPGWEQYDRWNVIRNAAPNRKPWLGYYDEHSPEMVDWQIKAAVENGITGFVVDWYWTEGVTMLTHWLESYEKAKYRDDLKVCVMWCNHVGKHTVEDMRAMTKFCVDHYFGWKSYYKIDGKPVFGIYESARLHEQFGDSKHVRQAMPMHAKEVAREAGYPGLWFFESGMRMNPWPDYCKTLSEEGYDAYTTYHDHVGALGLAPSAREVRYADVVRMAPSEWEQKRAAAGGSLTYLPVIETGWDPYPWHGDNSQILSIHGRIPDQFERLLSEAKTYCTSNKPPFLMMGPLNEWGEGSYIEPCVQYDFDMYERVRKVFGLGDLEKWPANVSPEDVGLGPYDYPAPTETIK